MRILKCQTCRNLWIYTGDLPDACICSMCRTTVRYGRAQVAIRWMDCLRLPDADQPVQGNTAIPFIDVYDRTINLAFLVAAEDGTHARTLIVPPRILDELGIPQQALTDAVIAAGGDAVRSCCYPISPEIRECLMPAFEPAGGVSTTPD